MQELDQAPFGIIGLETMLGLVVTRLIEPGHLDWPTALAKITINPARILGLPFGTLQVGAEADITIIDPHAEWTVAAEHLRSQSINTPFLGWKLKGRATHTIVAGEVKFALG
jgi:dihydroorotase